MGVERQTIVRVHVSSLIQMPTAPLYCERFFDGKGPVVFLGEHHLQQLNRFGRTMTDLEEMREDGLVE